MSHYGIGIWSIRGNYDRNRRCRIYYFLRLAGKVWPRLSQSGRERWTVLAFRRYCVDLFVPATLSDQPQTYGVRNHVSTCRS